MWVLQTQVGCLGCGLGHPVVWLEREKQKTRGGGESETERDGVGERQGVRRGAGERERHSGRQARARAHGEGLAWL